MRHVIRSAAGALLFAVALAFTLPGVSVSADPADPARLSSPNEAPMCRADAPIAEPTAVSGVANALRQRAAAAPDDGSVRVLNGAGYNYVTNRKVDFGSLERELRMRRARSH